MAEAPSFRISIRSIAAVGMVLRSTLASAPSPLETIRRPFTSTSVRFTPSERRFTRVAPSALYVEPPLLSWKLGELPCSGSICRNSPSVVFPLAWICSFPMTVTGAGVVRSFRRTRVPVTTTSSP